MHNRGTISLSCPDTILVHYSAVDFEPDAGTGYGQKTGATCVLRPITLEILNRSLPNLAQLTVCSFWTSRRNLFESTLENSSAIWRITLTVNKKVIKVMNWQWLHHAVVSALLLTIAVLNFVNWGETLMMVLTLQVSVFLAVCEPARERRPAAVTICNGHMSPWCRVASLCQAPRHIVSNFPPGWMKTTSA